MNAQPLINYINKYISLTEEEELFLISKITYRKYLKGQYIVQQNDICKKQCFIISGCTKTFYLDAGGQEHVVLFAIEDWWTSDMGSFTTQTPADFNVQCIENTELIEITYDDSEELFLKIPKLERFFRKIVEKAYAASQKRIIRSFSLNAKEQYLYFKEQYPTIEQRVPQYMIASYLGMTPEGLSRIRKRNS